MCPDGQMTSCCSGKPGAPGALPTAGLAAAPGRPCVAHYAHDLLQSWRPGQLLTCWPAGVCIPIWAAPYAYCPLPYGSIACCHSNTWSVIGFDKDDDAVFAPPAPAANLTAPFKFIEEGKPE